MTTTFHLENVNVQLFGLLCIDICDYSDDEIKNDEEIHVHGDESSDEHDV